MSAHMTEAEALKQLAWRLRNMHALYAERSTWVGFEQPRREAWREMAEHLKPLLARLDQAEAVQRSDPSEKSA